MQSLREKLLKAGLVTEEAASKSEKAATQKSAERPPRRPEPASRPAETSPRPPDSRREHSRLPKFAPLAGSKEAHRQQAKKQLEMDRRLRERVLETQLAPESGSTPFYFVTRKNKLRRLELSEAQAKALESGTLAVVERPDPDKIEHALVPAEVARAFLADFPRAVRFLNAKDAAIGFLSESDISTRAHEAVAGDTSESHDDEGSSADVPDAQSAAEAGSDNEAQKASVKETWITIKRAPKP